MFGQSQCTWSVGQSEQTVLVGRRDFVENEAFERQGIEPHRKATAVARPFSSHWNINKGSFRNPRWREK